MQLTKEQILRELGDILAKRKPEVKPKEARRAIAKALKHAPYDQWVELYVNTINGG